MKAALKFGFNTRFVGGKDEVLSFKEGDDIPDEIARRLIHFNPDYVGIKRGPVHKQKALSELEKKVTKEIPKTVHQELLKEELKIVPKSKGKKK